MLMRSYLARIPLWWPSLILVHAGLELWKMFDKRQIEIANGVVEYIYKPFVRDPAIWLMIKGLQTFGSFGDTVILLVRTRMDNNPPTHHDADKIFYPIGVALLVTVLLLTIRGIRRLFFGGRHEGYPI